jgi:hypothetical protein
MWIINQNTRERGFHHHNETLEYSQIKHYVVFVEQKKEDDDMYPLGKVYVIKNWDAKDCICIESQSVSSDDIKIF